MNAVFIDLSISTDEFERWYKGSAQDVLAYSLDGRKVRFPASILRSYVTHNGIKGRFKIVFDQRNRFQSIERIDLC